MIAGGVDELTRVELTWIEKTIEQWIRFGSAVEDQIIDARRRIVAFSPGTTFASVRWAANDFGTVVSRIDIMRAVLAGEAVSTIPFVHPGAEILLRTSGWPRVERVLQAIDAIEAAGIDPCAVAPDHWRHIHNRLTANEGFRAYTLAQHRAWLQRKVVLQ